MQPIFEGGEIVYLIDGLDPTTKSEAKFGITKQVTTRFKEMGNTVRLAHLLKIVDPGLIVAKFAFKGLKRPLQYGNDLNGDGKKFIFSWKPRYDYDWPHARRYDGSLGVTEREAPPDRVFVVVTTPNELTEEYPSVNFWIEGNWTWVEESESCSGAPKDWETRYEEKIKLYE